MKKIWLLFLLLVIFLIETTFMAGVLDDVRFKLCDMLTEKQGSEDLFIRAEGAVAKSTMRDVREAAEEMNPLLDAEMHVALPKHVKVYVAGSQEIYAQVLAREFSLETKEAEGVANISGGWSGGKHCITAINGAANVMKGRSDRIHTTGHELFHQVQYALANGKDTDEKALFWLEEGTADYMGALLSERMNGRTRDKWIADITLELLSAPRMARIADLQHLDLAERKHIMGKEFHAYSVSDLMTWYLLNQLPKGTEGECLTNYFQGLGAGRSGEESFEKAFGMTTESFFASFSHWWEEQRNAPLEFHIENGSVKEQYVRDIKQYLAFSHTLVEQRLGYTLHGAYTLVLAMGQEDFVNDIMAYCDVEKKTAEELAASSLWVENGSTILLNAGELQSKQQTIFTLGTMVARIFERQRMATDNKEPIWLVYGSSYLMGVDALSESGYGTLRDYRRTWILKLREQKAIPKLADLQTEESYQHMVDIYGHEIVSLVMELGTYELIDSNGWASYARWIEEVRETENGKQGFRNVWGKSAKDFALDFDHRLHKE